MKFIYPAVFRKTEEGTYKDISLIWRVVTVKGIHWTKLLKMQMLLLLTGSVWNWTRADSFLRFPNRMILNCRKAKLYGIFQ